LTNNNWTRLNNEVKVIKDGRYQLEKDKEAVKDYMVNYVNQNTVFFHDLEEKIDYLIKNEYYDSDTFDKYTFKQVKNVFKLAYARKFRFPSFMSAFKFYNNYALKTDDGSKFLERYEDRVSVNALFLADGDFEKAKNMVQVLINQEYQPATPTFLNAARKRSGDLVSCFLLTCPDTTEGIMYIVESSAPIPSQVSINSQKYNYKEVNKLNTIWRKVKGFEDYMISNKGEVMSFKQSKNGKLMKPSIDKDGYLEVGIRDFYGKRKYFRVHRLVAIHFIPNPKMLELVNHRDGVVSNNNVDNLEWVTASGNTLHSFRCLGRKGHNGGTNKRIKKIDKKSNKLIREYSSIHEAASDNHITVQAISRCLNGKCKTSAGFKWEFIDKGVETIESTLNSVSE